MNVFARGNFAHLLVFYFIFMILWNSEVSEGELSALPYSPITTENAACLVEVSEMSSDDGWVMAIAFSPTDEILAFGTQNGVVQTQHISDMTVQWRYKQEAPISSVAFNYDGTLLASGSTDGTIMLWNAKTNDLVSRLEEHYSGVLSISFHPFRNLLASSRGDIHGLDNTVRLRDFDVSMPEVVLIGHTWEVTSVAFSPDGQLLASGDGDGVINIWDVTSGQELHSIEGHASWVLGIQFSPEGDLLVSVGRDGAVVIWDPETGEQIAIFQGHTNVVYSASFNLDGALLITSDGDGLVLGWDVQTGERLVTLHAHELPVVAVAFNTRGDLIATGSTDNTIKLWAVSNRGGELKHCN